MAETTIRVRATRDVIRQALTRIPEVARSGGTIADTVMSHVGSAALNRIRRAFVTKSRGGTDDAGEKWKSLAPSTIARRRRSGHGMYGDDILRDTGLLFGSLSPGAANDLQVLRVGPGEVTVGTNRKWAGVHHQGSRDGRTPQRRLWPEPHNWPLPWWNSLLSELQKGLIDIAIQLVEGTR